MSDNKYTKKTTQKATPGKHAGPMKAGSKKSGAGKKGK